LYLPFASAHGRGLEGDWAVPSTFMMIPSDTSLNPARFRVRRFRHGPDDAGVFEVSPWPFGYPWMAGWASSVAASNGDCANLPDPGSAARCHRPPLSAVMRSLAAARPCIRSQDNAYRRSCCSDGWPQVQSP
jgi:hypothetical protein